MICQNNWPFAAWPGGFKFALLRRGGLLMIFGLRAQGRAHGQFNERFTLHDVFKPFVNTAYKTNGRTVTLDEMLIDQRRIIREYEADPTAYSDGRPGLAITGLAYGYCNETNKAVAALSLFVGKNPDDAPGLCLLGIAKFAQGDRLEGVKFLEKSWSTGYMPALGWLGLFYATSGKWNDLKQLV